MGLVINGLDALFREIEEVEHHFHSRERWLGAGATQATLTPYQAISGAGALGAEVAVLAAANTPIIAGNTRFDLHRIHFTTASKTTPYYVRIIYGSGTVAAAEAAGQYSATYVETDGPTAEVTVPVQLPRLYSGIDKVWIKIMNATNLATLDFFVGIHEYPY